MALPRFDEGQAFGPWIKEIAANCARSAVRRQKRIEQPARQGMAFAPSESPEQAVASKGVQEAVRDAINRLPLQQRTAIRLFSLE
jgi:DNA-directed RNA polymerase specialized sigma24 family protein